MAIRSTKGYRISPRKIIFRSMFILSLVFIMVSISFSWLYNGSTATVSGITLKTDEANNLLLRSAEGEWVKHLTLTPDEDFAFRAVTGDGFVFYEPVIEMVGIGTDDDGNRYYDYATTALTRIEEERIAESVLICDVSATIERGHDLVLAGASAHRGGSSDPKEYVSTAMRVMLCVQEEGDYRPLLMWIPDPTVLTFASDYVVDTEAEAKQEETVIFTGEDQVPYSVSIEGESGHFLDEAQNVIYAWGDITEDLEIAELLPDRECRLRIVIWIDGNDPDCHTAFMGGQVLLEMNFTAVRHTADEGTRYETTTE